MVTVMGLYLRAEGELSPTIRSRCHITVGGHTEPCKTDYDIITEHQRTWWPARPWLLPRSPLLSGLQAAGLMSDWPTRLELASPVRLPSMSWIYRPCSSAASRNTFEKSCRKVKVFRIKKCDLKINGSVCIQYISIR